MQSKDLILLQDSEGYINISSIMANENLVYDTPHMKQNFLTDDQVRVFWKPRVPKSLSHFSEVLASHMARHFGVSSTKYFFAKWDGVLGTISRDYKKTNERELLGRDFLLDYCKETRTSFEFIKDHEKLNNIAFIKEALDYYVKKDATKKDEAEFSISKQDAQKILKTLLTNYMIDITLLNADCHHLNWGLLIDTKNGKTHTRLIPNMDKELGFLLHFTQGELLSWVKDYHECPTKENAKKMAAIFKNESSRHTPGLNILPEEDKYGGRGKPYLKSMQELKTMFPNTFETLLQKFYQLNFSKLFESVEKETKVKVPTLVKLVVTNAYETRYLEIKKQFGSPKEVKNTDENLLF